MRAIHTRTAVASIAMAMATVAAAQIPTGYYDDLTGKSGAELKTAVHSIIKDASVLEYGSGTGRTWQGFYSTDRMDNNQVVDRYSNDVRYFTTEGQSVSGMNIEHSFPKSWWGGSKNQAYRDLYNLMPCEMNINSAKSNYPMGEVTNQKSTNGCTKIGTGNNGYQLWEPADKWKGEFARGYMYMATAYQNLTWNGTQALQILQQDEYPTLQQWAYTLYLKWARADEVDSMEVARNHAVSHIQGNRNPFVDFPNLMEYIWGDSIDYAFDPTTTLATSTYTSLLSPWDTIYAADFTATDGEFTVSDATVWKLTSAYGWKASAYINHQRLEADASLVSPMIDLASCTNAKLTFDHTAKYAASFPDVLSVEVICDGQTTELQGVTWPTGADWTFCNSGDISLDDFVGKKIQVAFHYTSSDSESATWEIKSIAVTGRKQSDGIRDIKQGNATLDLSQPHDTYTLDGKKDSNAKGVVIIRQHGQAWKVTR